MDERSTNLEWLLLATLLAGCESPLHGPIASAAPTPTVAPSASTQQSQEVAEAEIRALFDRYVKLSRARDGDGVTALVTASTHAYFEGMRSAALSAPAADVKGRGLYDKLTVLTLRKLVPVDKLRSFSGRELVAFIVKTDGATDGEKELTTIRFVASHEALASVRAGGKSLPESLRVAREGGVWKMDTVSFSQALSSVMRQELASGGFSEDEWLLDGLDAEERKGRNWSLFEPLEGRR
jgi:hypothetical protein